jgi:hypothetical protein
MMLMAMNEVLVDEVDIEDRGPAGGWLHDSWRGLSCPSLSVVTFSFIRVLSFQAHLAWAALNLFRQTRSTMLPAPTSPSPPAPSS